MKTSNLDGRQGFECKPVLVVEDDSDYAILIQDALEESGRFAPTIVASRQEASRHDYSQFSAIILDYNLPDGTGIQILREITAVSATPVIMLTAEDVVELAVDAIRSGAFSYLVKRSDNLEILPEIAGQAVEEAQRRHERTDFDGRIQRAERLASLGTLAAGMCHEMNNPLAGIIGYADMYLSGYDVDVHSCMETILQAANRLSAVVESLASYAAGAESPRERFNVVDSVRAAIENQKLLERGIAVTLEMPEAPVEVVANWLGIHQVLGQVIRNALQAVEKVEDKRIAIRLDKRGENVEISVEDNGPGVSAEGQKRMFDPFYTTRDPGQGMGMGLAISHRVLDEQGGSIRYEAVESGGSRFIVTTPLIATPAE